VSIISFSKGLLYFIGIILTFIGLSFIILVILVNIVIGEAVIGFLMLIPFYYDSLWLVYRMLFSNMYLCFTVPTFLGIALIYASKKLKGKDEFYSTFSPTGKISSWGSKEFALKPMNDMRDLIDQYQKASPSKPTPRKSTSSSRGSSYSRSSRGTSSSKSHFDAMKAFGEYHQGTMDQDPQAQIEAFKDYTEAMQDMSPEDQEMYYNMFMWYSICLMIMFIIAAIVFALA
jgi:hypothetical protein